MVLTSTVDSFVEAVLTVSSPIAQFVEMNALFGPYTLYVVEGTSDLHLPNTYREKKHSKH